MFHWICPECGREIPPSVRECQACDPSAATPSVVEPAIATVPPPLPKPQVIPFVEAARPTLLLEAAPVETAVAQAAPAVAEVIEPEKVVEEPVVETAPPEPVTEVAPLVAEAVAAEKVVEEPGLGNAPSEPVVEAAPVVVEAVAAEKVVDEPVSETAQPEPVAEIAPVVAEAIAVEKVIEEPVVETASPEPVAEVAPVAAEAVAAEKVVEEPVIETVQPEPVAEVAPVIAEAVAGEKHVEGSVIEPVAEAPPVVAEAVGSEKVVEEPAIEITQPEPVAEAVPAVADVIATEKVIEEPVIEASQPEPAAEAAPAVAEAVEPEKVVEEAVIQIAQPEPVAEVTPVVAEPVVAEPVQPEPVAVVAPPAVEKVVEEAPPPADIKLQDVPDPLLALAEEIRAAQAARAAALAGPPNSDGLIELAGAVGVQQEVPAHQPAPAAEPVDAASVTQKFQVSEMVPEAAKTETAVALLAPPEPLPAPAIVQEPIAFHELRPATEPAPVALAKPETQPVAPQQEPEGPTLPMAPMQVYTPATSQSIKPVPPRAQILTADSGPRITLPGPTLPPELTKLQDADVFNVTGEKTVERIKEAIPPPKASTGPSWFVSLLVMLLLLAAGLGTVFYMLPHTVADAKPSPTPAVAATVPAPTGGNSPVTKFIEVTGFRIVTSSDANKKSEVQYLVVNHSEADISDANAFITLRSAKPGQAPLCRFSFKVPALGPFESKEMSSPIEKSTRAISLPDWQDLRAEVQISK